MSLLTFLSANVSADWWQFPWSKKQSTIDSVAPIKKPTLAARAKNTTKDLWKSTSDVVTLRPVREKFSKKPSGLRSSPQLAANNTNKGFWSRMWPGKKDDRSLPPATAFGNKSSSTSLFGNSAASNEKSEWSLNPMSWFRKKSEDDGAQTVQEFLAQPRPGESFWR